jgi:hypothetical protein
VNGVSVSPPTTTTRLPSDGLWGRQLLYGGRRLKDEFAQGEEFILWTIEKAGDVPIDNPEGQTNLVPKASLTVSKLNSPDERFEVGTLAGAIVAMADVEHVPGDLPAVVCWTETETKRGLTPATVLVGVRPYEE